MPNWEFITAVAIVAALAGGLLVLNARVADSRLRKWSLQAGYKIVWKQRRWLRCGPFTTGVSDGGMIYRLCIKSADGCEQMGWAACRTGLFPIGKVIDFRPDSPPGFPVVQPASSSRDE